MISQNFCSQGLLPTPGTAGTVPVNNSQSSQESPTPAPLSKSSAKVPLTSPPHPRPRPVPKSYQVSPPISSPPRPQPSRDLRVPARRSARSVSPLVTHFRSARDQTPPTKPLPSPIRWKKDEGEEEEEEEERDRSSVEESSESRTPSPVHRGHTPQSYRPVISPIVLSEEASDSAPAGSPSPLSLVRRENGLQVSTSSMYYVQFFIQLTSVSNSLGSI